MGNFWVVVADAALARVLEGASPVATLKEIDRIEHPEGRLHEGDLVTNDPGSWEDSSGRTANNQGPNRSSFERRVEEEEDAKFAREIVRYLDDARNHGRFERVSIIAAPSLLGDLRKAMGSPLKKMILEEINKDLTQASVEDIQGQLTQLAE